AAFAAVVLAVGLLPILSGTGEPKLVGETTSTTIAAMTSTTVTVGTTTTAPVLTAECSASGLPAPAAQEGLPDQVADVRLAMAQAAIACDYDTLEALAGPDLNTSFGGGGFDNIPMWEEQGTYPALELLVRLLDTPFATQEVEDLPRYYVWPSAFVYDTWDEIPAEDIEALLEVFTQEELDQIATFGAYAGWRIGITEDGDWEFFVAGD
ncbi:MAG TPA: hypothetical protein VIH55_02920, partial [Acidimicrobiia bacterium]